jgi:hypothetical protein
MLIAGFIASQLLAAFWHGTVQAAGATRSIPIFLITFLV